MATRTGSVGRTPRKPPAWQNAEIVKVFDEAPDAVTLTLQLREPMSFLPGQYYNVRLDVAGRERPVQRAYSVGSSPLPDPGVIDIGVREVPGGMISPRLVKDLPAGSHLSVRGPTGRFTWDGGCAPVLLVGAGSGLVPLMSMIRYAVFAGRTTPMWLICSAITYDHAFYHVELERLVSEQPWLRVAHCVTRDAGERRAAYHRRIDAPILSDVLEDEIPATAYLCGPPAMVEGVAADLRILGMPPGTIHTEKYD